MNVTVRRTPPFLAATIGVLLVIGVSLTPAMAGKGDKISATVNGHKVRFRRGLVCDGYNQAENIGVFSVVGGNKPRHLGAIVRVIVVGCGVDLAAGTPPLTCEVGYLEYKFAKNPAYRQWGSSSPDVQVSFDSFDGTRVRGTFSGTLQPESPDAGGPATVTNGSFSLVLGGDASCTNPAAAQ